MQFAGHRRNVGKRADWNDRRGWNPPVGGGSGSGEVGNWRHLQLRQPRL